MRVISVVKCPVCKGDTFSPMFKRGDGLPVAKCNTCEVLVVCKYPETLNNACSTNSFVKSDGSSVDAGYRDSLNNVSPLDFVRHLATVEAARLAMQKEKRLLLDVGAASGDFLALAHLFGWEDTHGVEISAYARAVARKLGVIEQYATLENIPSDCHFDFITAWEVIEYLLDLPSFMTALRAHLRSGGIFLCSTPDAGQADFYPRPEEWLGFHVSLEHKSYFTSTSLRKVLSQFFPYVMVWASHSGFFYHQLLR